MRRHDRQITDPARIEELLRTGRFVTLGLCADGEPYVVTLSYGYDAPNSRLYFHVAPKGHKLDVIACNPRACATIVIDHGYSAGECEHPFESLVLRGSVRVIDDPAEKRRAIEVLVAHLEPDPVAYWTSRTWKLEDRTGGFTGLRFDIENVTAKQGK
jgi:nitroimidazol reductase NimA-like FMN-containing flavoprotein (pyridoxamine 5'-phosphate oxidase superfamily)